MPMKTLIIKAIIASSYLAGKYDLKEDGGCQTDTKNKGNMNFI